MKRAARVLPLALLAAQVHGQTTLVNDPSDPDVTTIYLSVCPTAVTTTVTLPETVTYCPGPNCHGGPGPAFGGITALPGLGTEIVDFTTVGTDGLTTVYQEFETVFPQVCPTGGLQDVTFTITEECPCMATRGSNYTPSGFETTIYVCDACENGPITVTLTIPCATGPYATQMPATTGAGPGMTSALGPAITGGANMNTANGTAAPSVPPGYTGSNAPMAPPQSNMEPVSTSPSNWTSAFPSGPATYPGSAANVKVDALALSFAPGIAGFVALVAWLL